MATSECPAAALHLLDLLCVVPPSGSLLSWSRLGHVALPLILKSFLIVSHWLACGRTNLAVATPRQGHNTIRLDQSGALIC